MYNNYYENDYYRSNAPCYFNCPYCQPIYEVYNRFNEGQFEEEYPLDMYEDFEGPFDLAVRYPIYGNSYYRNRMELDEMAKMIFDEIVKDTKYIAGLPVTHELLHYIIKVVTEYLNEHHDKYIEPIEQKVQIMQNEIRKDLKWVFDILAVFGVTPQMAVDFIGEVVKIFLLQIVPVNAAEQNSPMWGV